VAKKIQSHGEKGRATKPQRHKGTRRNQLSVLVAKNTNMLSHEIENIGKVIVNAAYKIHKELGPGLLEKVYEICLAYEVSKEGIEVLRQLDIPIVYDGITFSEGLRLDLLVGGEVIVEVKAIDLVNPVWEAQILSHLKLTGKQLGFLINFNVPLIKNGIKRFINTKK
jgi:GxxExxY protein